MISFLLQFFFNPKGGFGNNTHERTSYIVNKLTNNEKEMIDKDISLDELSTAVEILKPNKYLGEDGIISEFYQTLMAIYQQRII